MISRNRQSGFTMKVVAVFLSFLLPFVCGEQAGLLGNLVENDPFLSASGMMAGGLVDSALKEVQSIAGPLMPLAAFPGSSIKKSQESMGKSMLPPFPLLSPMAGGFPMVGPGKVIKAKVPLKKVVLKKAAGAKVLAPKLKIAAALKKKPKVYSLKPIIHVIEKPVPVFHKVPIPKKVMVPKFYPVYKPIPVPKFIPVPFKVPVKKIIPKIVKIPKAIPIPKFVPVKKPIPFGIPYPVPKFYKVPIPKPVPYPKFIPIPIPKKVPKFIPVPVKKIIKVPKPFYVPIKVPYITASYMKTPMAVKVPNIKKNPMKFHAIPEPIQGFYQPLKGYEVEKGYQPEKVQQPVINFIPSDSKDVFKLQDSNTAKIAKLGE